MLKWAQRGINVLGFGVGVGCLSYGAVALRNSSPETLSIVTVAVGSLLTVQSCCMCSMNLYTDRRVERILTELNNQNVALRESVGNMNTLLDSQRLENEKQQRIVHEAQQNLDTLQSRTEELQTSTKRLRDLNREYQERLDQNRILSERMEAEIALLEASNHESEEQIAELQDLVAEQKQQIEQLAEQARNLNELQRRSVAMIQKLALYGNDCKKFGVELSDVAQDLRETDESLGLTVNEMQTQTLALNNIIKALERTDRSLRVHGGGGKRRVKKKKDTADGGENEKLLLHHTNDIV